MPPKRNCDLRSGKDRRIKWHFLAAFRANQHRPGLPQHDATASHDRFLMAVALQQICPAVRTDHSSSAAISDCAIIPISCPRSTIRV